jgi:dTDP-4-dehydrorhamnose reductase
VKVLITGAGGQLGRALIATAPAGVGVIAQNHADLDIADEQAVERSLCSHSPGTLINAAGFTQVDAAESEVAAVMRSNATGPAMLAATCLRHGVRLIHVSSDYVFDGRQSHPYEPSTPMRPINQYGVSKAQGERAVREKLPDHSAIIRTSWLYAAEGQNFLTRMLTLMSMRKELAIVSDQVGSPTVIPGLAAALWTCALRRMVGIYHWCDSGVASWYDFAVAIAEEAQAIGLLASVPAISPIASTEYRTAAARPPFSVLDKRTTEAALGQRARHWRVELRATLCSHLQHLERSGLT